MQVLNCMVHYLDLFSTLTVKLLLLVGQIGLVKQISALCCQSSSDPEQYREV